MITDFKNIMILINHLKTHKSKVKYFFGFFKTKVTTFAQHYTFKRNQKETKKDQI